MRNLPGKCLSWIGSSQITASKRFDPSTGAGTRSRSCGSTRSPSQSAWECRARLHAHKEWRACGTRSGIARPPDPDKADTVLAWGADADVRGYFKADLKTLAPFDIGDRLLTLDDHLYLKGFLRRRCAPRYSRQAAVDTNTCRSASSSWTLMRRISPRLRPSPDHRQSSRK